MGTVTPIYAKRLAHLRDLRYILTDIWPEAERLEREILAARPWQFRRRRRAIVALRRLHRHWKAVLDGKEHAPDGYH